MLVLVRPETVDLGARGRRSRVRSHGVHRRRRLAHLPRLDDPGADRGRERGTRNDRRSPDDPGRGADDRRCRSWRASRPRARGCSAWPKSQQSQFRPVGEDPGDAERGELAHPRRRRSRCRRSSRGRAGARRRARGPSCAGRGSRPPRRLARRGSRRRSRRAGPCGDRDGGARTSSSAGRWKQTTHGVVVEERERARDDVVATVAGRALQLDHHPIRPRVSSTRLLERRQACSPSRRVVGDHELTVGSRPDVELDEVRADLDRALERGQRVLRQVPRRAAVRDHERGHGSSRCTAARSISGISSSAAASRCRLRACA